MALRLAESLDRELGTLCPNLVRGSSRLAMTSTHDALRTSWEVHSEPRSTRTLHGGQLTGSNPNADITSLRDSVMQEEGSLEGSPDHHQPTSPSRTEHTPPPPKTSVHGDGSTPPPTPKHLAETTLLSDTHVRRGHCEYSDRAQVRLVTLRFLRKCR